MTRQAVREKKRAIHAAARPGADGRSVMVGRDCALSLLERSIAFRHERLAIIRLSIAVNAGADAALAIDDDEL